MARTQPPAPTQPPTPPIQRGDRATFSDRVDATITYLTNAPAEIGNIAQITYDNAIDAFTSATTAATHANTAMGYRDTTLTYRNTAQQAVTDAQAAQTAAEAARNAAQGYAQALTATSTSSHVIGAGAKTFVTQAGKQFTTGQVLYFVNPGNAAQWMAGAVTSYAGTNLAVNITDVNPATSGNTVATWNISIAGVKGATGATGGITGGNLTGALNEKQAPSVPVSAVPDIWSGAGNFVVLDGAGTITGFPDAPQLGAQRTLLVYDNVVLTHGANLIVYGGTQTLVAGDLVDVLCEATVNKFRATVRKRNGTATVSGGFRNTLIYLTSGPVTVPASDFEIELVGGPSGACHFARGRGMGASSGGYSRKRYSGATVGAVGTLTIGATGTAGTSSIDPASGTASSFVLAGFTTVTCGGGTAPNVTGGTPGDGGTATGGDINIPGQRGGTSCLTDMGNNSTGAFDASSKGGDGGDTPLGHGGLGAAGAGDSGKGYGTGASGGGYTIGGMTTYAPGVSAPAAMILRY